MNYSHRLNNFIIYRMISHNIKNTVCNVTESIVLAKCDGKDLYFLLEMLRILASWISCCNVMAE